MTWNVDTARKRIGLPDSDTSRDADLQACMDVALALAEKYCDRRFMFKAGEVVLFRDARRADLHVYRWPIKAITSVQASQADGSMWDVPYVVDKDLGVVYLGSGSGVARAVSRDITVTFDGGFEPLPSDLEWSLWAIFDQLWSTGPGWGQPAEVSADTGAVRSFSIDGMSIGYSDASASSGAADGGAAAWGIIPARAIASLEFYRAETAVGGA